MNKLINYINDINHHIYMNIKMITKDSQNLKNKIGLKHLLVQKNSQTFQPKNINIQTINIDKIHNYYNKDKKYFNTKNLNKIKYLNNSSYNYNINNSNYIEKEDQISLFNSSRRERVPSPIDSLNSSSFFTDIIKKRKQRRLHKKHKHKYKYNTSINNLSLNSNINNSNNSNNSMFFSSSSSSSDNDYSISSDSSYRNRGNKRKNYYEEMMVEENELDYLRKSEVGLFSSEEEDNNNSLDNSNFIEENFNNEIERILIEIYNRNISIITTGNYSELNKNISENKDIEKQIKKYLKRKNLKTNLLVLKSLCNKIRELVGKYREKVFEIGDIKNIYDSNQSKRQLLINNQIIHCNNSIGSNVTTNSNSNSYCESYVEEDNLMKNNLLINVQDEIAGKGLSNILLKELLNIKKTLEISSKEIECIFKYPLNILKDENGKKIKFSVELMQCEEFCKTILNDELISTLLNQIKGVAYQIKIQKYIKLIKELEENCEHKNEMKRFMEFINDKLDIIIEEENQNENENEINENENENENEINENENENEINENENNNNNNSDNYKEEINENSSNDEENGFNINNENCNGETCKKSKKKKEKNNEIEYNKENDNEMYFEDIDELLKYINDDTDLKKGRKKGKKNKKNKKQNNSTIKEKNMNESNYSLDDDFKKEFEDFKKDIEKNTIFANEINKINPCLSDEFLSKIK